MGSSQKLFPALQAACTAQKHICSESGANPSSAYEEYLKKLKWCDDHEAESTPQLEASVTS